MSPAQVFQFALAGLAANKLRSALTTLGILIGVGSVIMLVAVGNGSSQSVQNAISSLGTSSITVLHTEGAVGSTSATTAFAEPQNLTVQDAQALASAQEVASVSPAVSASETLSYGASSDSASLTGTYPSYFPAEDDTLSAGAYFTTQEVNTAQDVVVLGSEAASDLFGTANPVGKSVLVAGIPFTVVGVLAEKGASGLSSADNTAVAPLTTVQDALTGFGTLNDIVVLAKSAALVDTVEAEITYSGRDPGTVPHGGDSAVDDRRGARRPGRADRYGIPDRRGETRPGAVVDSASARRQRADRPHLRRFPR